MAIDELSDKQSALKVIGPTILENGFVHVVDAGSENFVRSFLSPLRRDPAAEIAGHVGLDSRSALTMPPTPPRKLRCLPAAQLGIVDALYSY